MTHNFLFKTRILIFIKNSDLISYWINLIKLQFFCKKLEVRRKTIISIYFLDRVRYRLFLLKKYLDFTFSLWLYLQNLLMACWNVTQYTNKAKWTAGITNIILKYWKSLVVLICKIKAKRKSWTKYLSMYGSASSSHSMLKKSNKS